MQHHVAHAKSRSIQLGLASHLGIVGDFARTNLDGALPCNIVGVGFAFDEFGWNIAVQSCWSVLHCKNLVGGVLRF